MPSKKPAKPVPKSAPPRAAAAPAAKTAITATAHRDTRVNIPTEELRDFVREDAQKQVVLYPRNPDLDPQLVWRGKDAQDQKGLEVPAVPVFIQEKIHPQAIIDDFRKHAAKPSGSGELDHHQSFLFDPYAAFNGLPEDFSARVDFYRHQGHWSNRLILGDSLLVMTSLAEKEGLKGRVQMVYFDPPYGIKFGSNWQVSTRKRDVKDGKHEDVVRQPEQMRAFRDTWELGIHSYLSYLRDRLTVARELLTESGSIFVQIGDENVHLVRSVLDEVFGSENFVSLISFSKTSGSTSATIPVTSDYLVWYAKNSEQVKFRRIYLSTTPGAAGATEYKRVELASGEIRPISQFVEGNKLVLPTGARVFATDSIVSAGGDDPDILLTHNGKEYRLSCKPNRHWKPGVDGIKKLWSADRLLRQEGLRIYKRYFEDFPYREIVNTWTDTRGDEDSVYVVQTDTKVIERCLLMTTDPGDLVLDPTCGSGTTAYVAEQCGRRWITTDTSRVALTLARTRLMAARFPYYIPADSPEGRKMEAGLAISSPAGGVSQAQSGTVQPQSGAPSDQSAMLQPQSGAAQAQSGALRGQTGAVQAQSGALPGGKRAGSAGSSLPPTPSSPSSALSATSAVDSSAQGPDIRRGFIYKRVPHVTLKSIANNPDIKEGMSRREIDAAIARHADTELLYDKPYEDNKRLRVTGPFTVESLSPHRTISFQQRRDLSQRGEPVEPGSESRATLKIIGPDDFGRLVLDNLKRSGVQNTFKGEKMVFTSLDPHPGEWIQGVGTYTDKNGKPVKVAVCIGPEHGTVGPELVKEAAKEAVKGVGFDTLLIAGFAFDPHVGEEAKRYGALTVLPVRINSDIAMGDLLKKTGAGNLFMIFGEPDITIRDAKKDEMPPDAPKDARVADYTVAEIKGLDVYDPTTGEVRSSSTDDIACWFIDTDYNGESFFVRHAYFTGAGSEKGEGPYDKLRRALKAEVDEAAWSALYSTVSRPFPKPRDGKKPGKIAIKVINHYGDEVLKVVEVR